MQDNGEQLWMIAQPETLLLLERSVAGGARCRGERCGGTRCGELGVEECRWVTVAEILSD